MAGTVSLEELNRQYSPSQWSHRSGDVVESYIKVTQRGSAEVRKKVRHERDCPVPGSGQSVDVYWPDEETDGCKSVLCFVHGGNWQACDKSDQGYLAEPFTERGVIVVAIGYTTAPAGNMSQMIEEIRLAVVYLSQRFPSSRLYLAGYSAGAHLSTMAVCCNDGQSEAVRSAVSHVHGLILISGMFDLEPVQKSYVNDELHLTAEDARLLSPAHQCSYLSSVRSHLDVIIAMAEHDSLEYRCQSMDYTEILRSHGVCVTKVLDVDGEDHFTIVEKLSSHDFCLTQAILNLLQTS